MILKQIQDARAVQRYSPLLRRVAGNSGRKRVLIRELHGANHESWPSEILVWRRMSVGRGADGRKTRRSLPTVERPPDRMHSGYGNQSFILAAPMRY